MKNIQDYELNHTAMKKWNERRIKNETEGVKKFWRLKEVFSKFSKLQNPNKLILILLTLSLFCFGCSSVKDCHGKKMHRQGNGSMFSILLLAILTLFFNVVPLCMKDDSYVRVRTVTPEFIDSDYYYDYVAAWWNYV